MTRASLDKRPADVAAMFDRTARRYDLMNDLMTGGQNRLWRRAVAAAVGARPGERVLDLAAGTGTSSIPFVKAGARCVACDFSLGMLREGVRRCGRSADGPAFVAGDALRLPFRDATFDAVTISFGLRNVADIDQALVEMWRVTRPGGRLLVCEVGHPPNRLLALAHRTYLKTVLPRLARFSSNPESYRYLTESTLAWPDRAGLGRRLEAGGWESVRWRGLTLGVVVLHFARRGEREAERG